MKNIAKIVGSKYFTFAVVGLFVLQALWVALSFKFPMIYDEGTHVGFIQSYSKTLLPYTTDTPANMTTQVSLFHYVMGMVYRLVGFFTDNFTLTVVLLRLIGIAMFAFGLVLFTRTLRASGFARQHINVGLLLFVLLPITPLVAATVNSDNMLFLLTALYLLIAVKIINSKNIFWQNFAQLIIVGLAASLVKYSFLPIFAVSASYLSVLLALRYKGRIVEALRKSFRHSIRPLGGVVYVGGIVLLGGLFVVTYVSSLVQYGSIRPSCTDTRPLEQCLANSTVKRNIEAKQTSDERATVLPSVFLDDIWAAEMVKVTNWSGNSASGGNFVKAAPLPIMNEVLYFGILVGAGFTLYSWRMLKKSAPFYFLVVTSGALLLAVLYLNARSYYDVHLAYAIQPRYLLGAIPIVLSTMVWSASVALGRHTGVKMVLFAALLILLTQGGGVMTHLLRSQDDWYWQNDIVIRTNKALKDAASPFVKQYDDSIRQVYY